MPELFKIDEKSISEARRHIVEAFGYAALNERESSSRIRQTLLLFDALVETWRVAEDEAEWHRAIRAEDGFPDTK